MSEASVWDCGVQFTWLWEYVVVVVMSDSNGDVNMATQNSFPTKPHTPRRGRIAITILAADVRLSLESASFVCRAVMCE
jgi:hypothetical protein